jgi:hypothetical protein
VVAVLQAELPDIFLGGQACQGFHLTVEGTMAHRHLISDEWQVDILTHHVVADDTIQLVKKLSV